MRRGQSFAIRGLACFLVLAFLPWPSAPIVPQSVPRWTYLDDLLTVSDPIDLVFLGATLSGVASQLRDAGWLDVGNILGIPCQFNEFVKYLGRWRQQDLGLVKDETTYCAITGTRFHIRLWDLGGGVVVGAAHIDHAHGLTHIVHDFEAAEREATIAFLPGLGLWRVCADGLWLSNPVNRIHDASPVRSDGYATVVVGRSRWCPSTFLS